MKSLSAWLLALALVVSPLGAGLWFNQAYLGWLNESIPDANAYAAAWQETVDGQQQLRHPAVIHWLPSACLCRLLTLPHAVQISAEAAENGFNIYQFNGADRGLGEIRSVLLEPVLGASPTILITDTSGQVRYVGAYSDGIRCASGDSLVNSFIADPQALPQYRVVGLNVQTCRCLTP